MSELEELRRELKTAQAHESKDLLDLAKLVADMRHAQRESDRTLRFNALETMMRKEKQVDEALDAIFGDQQRPLL